MKFRKCSKYCNFWWVVLSFPSNTRNLFPLSKEDKLLTGIFRLPKIYPIWSGTKLFSWFISFIFNLSMIWMYMCFFFSWRPILFPPVNTAVITLAHSHLSSEHFLKLNFPTILSNFPPILPSHWERIRQPKMKFITTLRSINLPGAVLWLGAPSTLTGCPFNPDLHNT